MSVASPATVGGLNNLSNLSSGLPSTVPSTQTPVGVVPISTATSTATATPATTAVTTPTLQQSQHNLVHQRNGEQIYNAMEKINSELLSMTYGAMVTQLIKDYKDVKVVNTELEKMFVNNCCSEGYNIGVRLVDEFLAKSNLQSCVNFRETAQVLAKVAFKMFLGITAEVTRWREDGRQCSLIFKSNPLAEFVELPYELYELDYNILICGAIRGSLQMLQMNVECQLVKDEVKGSSESEIRLTLKEILVEAFNDEEEH